MRTFGEEIRNRLQELHLGVRRVDTFSRNDANAQHNGALHISKYRFRELEQNAQDITVAEIAEFARLCHTTFSEMLNQYLRYYPNLLDGVDFAPSTRLLTDGECEWIGTEPRLSDETGLLTKDQSQFRVGVSGSNWAPDAQYIYGRIGLTDLTMWPLLQPGSVVRVNTRQKLITRRGSWHNDYDRPIYFLEIRDGYACGWCDLNDRQIILTPHSLSPTSPRFFLIGREAEVRGRVVGYAVDYEAVNTVQRTSRHDTFPQRSVTEQENSAEIQARSNSESRSSNTTGRSMVSRQLRQSA